MSDEVDDKADGAGIFLASVLGLGGGIRMPSLIATQLLEAHCCGDPHCEIRRGVRRDAPAEEILEHNEQRDNAG